MQSNHWPPWGGDPMMLLGQLLERTDSISETVQDTSGRVTRIEHRLIEGTNRMDQLEKKQEPPRFHRLLLPFLKEVASLKQWLSGGLLVFLFAKGIFSASELKAVALKLLIGPG